MMQKVYVAFSWSARRFSWFFKYFDNAIRTVSCVATYSYQKTSNFWKENLNKRILVNPLQFKLLFSKILYCMLCMQYLYSLNLLTALNRIFDCFIRVYWQSVTNSRMYVFMHTINATYPIASYMLAIFLIGLDLVDRILPWQYQ